MLTARQLKASLIDLAEDGHVFLESSAAVRQVQANVDLETHVRRVDDSLWVVYTGRRLRIRKVLRLLGSRTR